MNTYSPTSACQYLTVVKCNSPWLEATEPTVCWKPSLGQHDEWQTVWRGPVVDQLASSCWLSPHAISVVAPATLAADLALLTHTQHFVQMDALICKVYVLWTRAQRIYWRVVDSRFAKTKGLINDNSRIVNLVN